MKNANRSLMAAGLIVGTIAVGGAPSLASEAGGANAQTAADVTTAVSGGLMEILLFYFVAAATAVSALGVCISRNIVRMATWLFMALGSVSMLYFMLAANFLGAIQLIVYSGGTLVLLIFGVMLTSKSPWVKFECGTGEMAAAGVVCGALFGCLCSLLTRAVWGGTQQVVAGPELSAIGERLLTVYVVPFEVAGVLLMIVMVGAAHLARQEE
ncbi:MAG: NADH-quinone oxidoreductase subunit J [Planctomycetota bacterium]